MAATMGGSGSADPMHRPCDTSTGPAAATGGNAISLFSNCGAGDVGFADAGFQFRIMAERVESRLAVALRNHPSAQGVPGDLRDTWRDVAKLWQANHGASVPDLLAACPPCQGMSTARSDRGAENDPDASSRDPRNLLVLPIAAIAAELQPTIVVVENVAAFLRRLVRDPQSTEPVSAARLLSRLLEDSYDVFPFLTDLADYGVPQTRKRAFLTFVRRNSPEANALRQAKRAPYPTPTSAPDYGGHATTLEVALQGFGLASLDAADRARAADPEHPLHFVPVWPERQYRMVAAIPPGSGASAWENTRCDNCGPIDADAQTVVCGVCGEPLLRPVVLDDERPRLAYGFRRVSYRRMDPARPAATITTASGRVGGSRTIHPFENRILSPLECALLQTIPSDFDWGRVVEERGVMELRAMIGEAVPPQFTRLHGQLLMRLMTEHRAGPRAIGLADRRCETAGSALRPN